MMPGSIIMDGGIRRSLYRCDVSVYITGHGKATGISCKRIRGEEIMPNNDVRRRAGRRPNGWMEEGCIVS